MLIELVTQVPAEAAEALADALLEAGALAVTVEDADADTPAESALYGEPGSEPERLAWQRSRVIAQVEATADIDGLIARAAALCDFAVPAFERRPVLDTDWVRRTQAEFVPLAIGRRLWIVPSWHAPPQPDAINVRLDPGVAFGTGSHPTTRLCLEWLEANLPPRASVLDYGCGSGILAIAAAKLGAARVVGTDIDTQALGAATANATANAVTVAFVPPEAVSDDRFDVVLANILANPLRVLAGLLTARVATGGALVLAGILERQADELLAVYRASAPDMQFAVWRSADGWSCLAGRRPDGAPAPAR